MGTIRFTQQQRDVLWAAALSYRGELHGRLADGEGATTATDLAVLERVIKKLLAHTPADYVQVGWIASDDDGEVEFIAGTDPIRDTVGRKANGEWIYAPWGEPVFRKVSNTGDGHG